MPSNSNLNRANVAGDNEFYTRREDIEDEMEHYKEHFIGKTIYLNCDDYRTSQFYAYFKDNFARLGLYKLIATHYIERNLFSDIKPAMAEYDGIKETVTPLSGDGDFASDYCREILFKQADICITNPPFSIKKKWMALALKSGKFFIVLLPIHAIEGQLVDDYMEGRVRLGYNRPDKFIRPDGAATAVACMWLTNLPVDKHRDVSLVPYVPGKYHEYLNYDAIEIGSAKTIPDYRDGVMGVPITYLFYHNPNRVDILGYISDSHKHLKYSITPRRYFNVETQKYMDGLLYMKDGIITEHFPRFAIKLKSRTDLREGK